MIVSSTGDGDTSEAAIEAAGGVIARQPYDDAHERRAVGYDAQGNGLVIYAPRTG